MSTRPVIGSPLIRGSKLCARAARGGLAVATVAVTVAGLAVSADAARTAPQPSVAQVQAKLNKLNSQENFLVQRYDQVSQDLTSARQRLSLVNAEVGRDRGQLQTMRGQIGQIASLAYENGSLNSAAAVLTSSDPQQILGQSSFLSHLSANTQDQLTQALTTASQLAGAKQYAARITHAVAGLKRQLAGQKATLDKLIAQQKNLLASLTPAQQSSMFGGTTKGTDPVPTSSAAGKAVAFAYAVLGCPYVFGGTGPCSQGFDCSGLTMSAWASAGVSIPRTSYGQATLTAVPSGQMQPGDILEFAGDSHVAIYVGGGMLIDAPTPGMNVEKVSLSSSWYSSNFDGAYRP